MRAVDYFVLGSVALFVALMIAAKAVDRRNLRRWEQGEAARAAERAAEQTLRDAGWPEDLIRPWAEPAAHEDAKVEPQGQEAPKPRDPMKCQGGIYIERIDEHGETQILESWGHSKRCPEHYPLVPRPDTSGFVKVVELGNGQNAIVGIDDPEPEVTPKALPCPHGSRRWVQFEKNPNGGLRHAYSCQRSVCPPIWVDRPPR